MNVAVILAGGTGSRLGNETPKQFFKVAGKTVIEHTIEVFENNTNIYEIAVVIHQGYVATIDEYVLKNGWKKVKKIIKGGDERHLSSLAAIDAYSDFPNYNLLFHDAVRPLISNQVINKVIDALQNYNAIDVAVPTSDTIIQVNEAGTIIEDIPVRKYLRRGQTPQAFKQKTIKDAYNIALKDTNFSATDDCGTVKKYLPTEPIFVVEGEESNIKLTYKEDAYLMDKLFQLRSTKFEEKIDLKKLNGKVIVVFGGNSGIGKDICKIAKANNAKVFSFSRTSTNTDIANREDVKNVLLKVFEETSRIDYVVNAAAILSKEPLITMTDDSINSIISTNYNGMVNVAIESFEYLKASKGQLLLYTSSSYTRGRAFYSLYSSTKAAVVNFMQAVAQEWEIFGIKVNVINPERTKTPMRTKNFGNEDETTLLSSEIVAETSLKVLLSNFTGQVIDVKK